MRRIGSPGGLGPDRLLAAGLALAGEVEVVLGPAAGGESAVLALAVALVTVPLAWRRTLPLLPVAAVLGSLLLAATLGGFFDAEPVVPLVAMVLALYSAGRYAPGARGLAGAALAAAGIAAVRIGFDPMVDEPAEVVQTIAAVALPVLIGRWMAGQAALQRELEATAERRERERELAARHAAEEERMRIALDLQAAVAGGLGAVFRDSRELRRRIETREHARARELLERIAGAAREALADVRRVLGVLRRDPEPPRLAPPATPLISPAHPTHRAAPTAAPEPPVRWRTRWSTAFVDRAVAATVGAAAALELTLRAPAGEAVLGPLLAAAIAAPLLWRRRRPVVAALAVLAAVALQSAILGLDAFPATAAIGLIAASYAIGAHAERREALVGAALLAAGLAAHAAAFHPDAVPIALLGAGAVPWTTGRILRAQRLVTREVLDRVVEAERGREREARAAVTGERMRVARELHDAVAHNVSVIAIQAAGADGILERDPERAAQCAALIESVAGEALAELGRLTGTPAVEPAEPSLARVDALVARTRDAGLPVELRVEGEPAALPAGVDLAAFRIVQEALANASKHAGPAHVRVVVRYAPRAVEVEVRDDGRGTNGRAAKPAGGGHGLVGMRERAALYGGTLDVSGAPHEGFAVKATLPVGRP